MTSDNSTSTSIDHIFSIDVNRALVPVLLALAVFSIFGFCW
jgi:hypothetical protein